MPGLREAVFAVAFVAWAPALAKKPILLESYADPRPMGMARNVEQIVKAFGPANVIAGEELRRKLEPVFSRSVSRGSADEIQALLTKATEGVQAFTSSSFTVAIAELSQAVDDLANQTVALSLDPKLREARRDALLTLVKAYVKTNNVTAAQAALRELYRSFPELPALSEAQYPPRVVALANQVLGERAEQAGTLEVKTRPSRRAFYLNEQPGGTSPRTITNLLPGTYRIYAPGAADPRRGSLRLVEVKPRQSTEVSIDSEVEDRLETESYIGLRFTSRAEKDRFEIPLACAIAAAIAADEVIILTQQRSRSSGPELLGAVYAADGRFEWGVILPLTPQPDDQALARFAVSIRMRREMEGVKVAPEPPSRPSTKSAVVAAPAPLSSASDERAPVEAKAQRDVVRFELGRGRKIALGTSLGLGAAMTAAWLTSSFAFDCAGAVGGGSDGPCGPGTAGRWTTSSLFGLALGGLSVGTGFLIGVVADYAAHRARAKIR
jgi:hypothetical protein